MHLITSLPYLSSLLVITYSSVRRVSLRHHLSSHNSFVTQHYQFAYSFFILPSLLSSFSSHLSQSLPKSHHPVSYLISSSRISPLIFTTHHYFICLIYLIVLPVITFPACSSSPFPSYHVFFLFFSL